MAKTGQKNFAYAGNTDTTGIPMRGQMPIFGNRRLTKSISCADLDNNNKYSTIGNGKSLIKSSSTIYSQNNDNTQYNKYRIEDKNTNINMNNYRIKNQEKIPEPLWWVLLLLLIIISFYSFLIK